ncbi:MAG: hypothetical protein H6742_20630 [Alphaproteobacteria bacterium]|nr:hypothetical protein [Alphaproteobacteria bacterium]
MVPSSVRSWSALLLLGLAQACIIYVPADDKPCRDRWDDDCRDDDDWSDDQDEPRPGAGSEECEGIEAYYEAHAEELHMMAEECWGGDGGGGGEDPWAEECRAILTEMDAMLAGIGLTVEDLWRVMLEAGPLAAQELLRAHGMELPEDQLWLIFECYETVGWESTDEGGGSGGGGTDSDGDGIPNECEAVSIDEPWTGDCDELAVYFEALERCWEG